MPMHGSLVNEKHDFVFFYILIPVIQNEGHIRFFSIPNKFLQKIEILIYLYLNLFIPKTSGYITLPGCF